MKLTGKKSLNPTPHEIWVLNQIMWKLIWYNSVNLTDLKIIWLISKKNSQNKIEKKKDKKNRKLNL